MTKRSLSLWDHVMKFVHYHLFIQVVHCETSFRCELLSRWSPLVGQISIYDIQNYDIQTRMMQNGNLDATNRHRSSDVLLRVL